MWGKLFYGKAAIAFDKFSASKPKQEIRAIFLCPLIPLVNDQQKKNHSQNHEKTVNNS